MATAPDRHNGAMLSNECTVSSRVWRVKGTEAGPIPFERVSDELADPDSLVWVDLVNPTDADMNMLGDELGIGAAALEDATAPHERPKVTRHGTHLFFTTYATTLTAADDQADLTLSRVSGYLMEGGLITVRLDETFDMTPVVQAWEDNADLVRFGAGALIHGLLDVIVDGHFEAIQQLDDAIENMEDQLFEQSRTGPQFQRRVYALRKQLVQLRRVVLPMREVVNGLLRHRKLTDDALDALYDDLYDHVLRAAEWTESVRDMVTTVFETNLSLQNARLNSVMKKLAGWAAIIAVPTAVTGWFGQNIPFPGFAAHWGLIQSIVLILALSIGLYALLRKRDWI
jgi:magnesium transporter